MERNVLTVAQVPKELKENLKIVAKNSLQTRSEFLRPIIRQIVEKHRNSLDLKNETKEVDYIRITGISPSVLKDLKKISENMGISQSQLVKIELNAFIQGLPDYLRTPED